MNDKLKPVRCGCGGEARIVYIDGEDSEDTFVECTRCRISIPVCPTEEEAIEDWNRAMGAKDIDVPTKWIPVYEKLPENNRQVLVYAQSVHFALAKYDEMMEPDGTWKKQWVTFDAWKPYYTIKNVIAWMPLPEPYRAEGKC